MSCTSTAEDGSRISPRRMRRESSCLSLDPLPRQPDVESLMSPVNKAGLEHNSSGGLLQLKTPKKEPSSLPKKKRKRFERLMVLYGPDISFQKYLTDRLLEEYKDNLHFPPIVTTLPQNHAHASEFVSSHALEHVEAPVFEKMVSSGDLLCYYHVFETKTSSLSSTSLHNISNSSSSTEIRHATEGECTVASSTDDSRQFPTLDCASPKQLASMGKAFSSAEISVEYCSPGLSASVRSDSLDSPSKSPADKLSPNMAKGVLCRKVISNLTHPPLTESSSAPGAFDCVGSLTSLRHTYYFGFKRKVIRDAFQEANANNAVLTMLVPQTAAQQMHAWVRGRFPNVFVACYENISQVSTLRAEHAILSDDCDDALEHLHIMTDMVTKAQRFDKTSYVDSLAYFQSRQFLLERKNACSSGEKEKMSALNPCKIRVDRCIKPEKDLLVTMAECEYNSEDPMHLRISRTLFHDLTKFGGTCPANGRHWLSIGCEENGSLGVDGCGMVAFLHLLHLTSTQGLRTLMRDIYQLSEGGKRFKFMEVSARMTKSVLVSLHTSYVQKVCNQRQQVFGVLNDIYAGALLKFFELFQSASGLADVPSILTDVDGDIRNHSRRLLLSVESHFQGCSFHAQVTSPVVANNGVGQTTSLTSVSQDMVIPGESSNHMLTTRSRGLSNSAGVSVRSCPNVTQAVDSASTSDSLSAMRFLGSTPNMLEPAST